MAKSLRSDSSSGPSLKMAWQDLVEHVQWMLPESEERMTLILKANRLAQAGERERLRAEVFKKRLHLRGVN